MVNFAKKEKLHYFDMVKCIKILRQQFYAIENFQIRNFENIFSILFYIS